MFSVDYSFNILLVIYSLVLFLIGYSVSSLITEQTADSFEYA